MEQDNKSIVQDETFGCETCQYHYNYSDHIAKGAFGTVFQATVTNRGDYLGVERVAVKVVHLNKQSDLTTDGKKWSVLRQKLKNLLEFSHNHLVTYHKVTITKGSLGGVSIELMMDYHTGEDLYSLLRNLRQQRALMSETAAVSYATEIAEGLKFLHDRRIIHGDLKPNNILTMHSETGDRKLAICDLDDIVQMERDATCSHDITHLRGTVRYMSPEMLKKFTIEEPEHPGRKTDIWSLGCILLELADCVVGNDQRWLHKGNVKVEIDSKVNDERFIQLIVDGYVPFAVQTIPSHIAANVQQCIRAKSAERISAKVLLQRLKSREFILIFHHVFQRDSGDLFYHPITGHNYGCLFDPSTKRITEFPLPVHLRKITLSFQFPVLNHSLVCQTMSSLNRFETIVWDIKEQKCQPIKFSGSSERMVCPVAVVDKIYFWNLDGMFRILDLHSRTIAAVKLPQNPPKRKQKIIAGVQCGTLIAYAGQYTANEHKSLKKCPTWMIYFDTVTSEWASLPDLPDRRANFAMVALQNSVYVLGGDIYESSHTGITDNNNLRSCLRLDMHSPARQWQKIRDLLQARWSHCAFVSDNLIYVFGGRGEMSATSSVMEVYDTERDLWSCVSVAGNDCFFECNATMSRAVNITLS